MTETEAPKKTNVPERYRDALYHVVPDAIGGDFSANMGRWLHANSRLLRHGGNVEGRYNYEILNVDKHCEHLHPLRQRLIAEIPEALKPCGLDDFDLDEIDIHAVLYHHGSFFDWHDDALGPDGEPLGSRRIAFAYYMHTEPKMFNGGELEFLDGTLVEPRDGALVMFHPIQRHRVRRVECWSAHVLHGRWALMGWLHGEAPD